MPLLVLLFALAAAPLQRPTDVVRWSASAPSAAVARGETTKVVLTARIQAGWKLYAIEQPKDGPPPLAFDVPEEHFALQSKQIGAPRAKVQSDENFGVDTRYYEKEASFTLPVTVARSAPEGRRQLPVEVTFQACGADICLRPFTQALSVPIEVKR